MYVRQHVANRSISNNSIFMFSGKLTLKPRHGTELGGTPIIVSVTQLTAAEDDNVSCIFDRKETVGSVINENEVLCVSPELTRTGRVPFELRITGQNSSFTGISIFISGKSYITLQMIYNGSASVFVFLYSGSRQGFQCCL